MTNELALADDNLLLRPVNGHLRFFTYIPGLYIALFWGSNLGTDLLLDLYNASFATVEKGYILILTSKKGFSATKVQIIARMMLKYLRQSKCFIKNVLHQWKHH